MSRRIELIELDELADGSYGLAEGARDLGSERIRNIEVGETVPEYVPREPPERRQPAPSGDRRPYRSPGAVDRAAQSAGARANLEVLERLDEPTVSDQRRELEALRARVEAANREELALLRRQAEEAEARVQSMRGQTQRAENARLNGVQRGTGSVWQTDERGKPMMTLDVFGPQVFGGGQW